MDTSKEDKVYIWPFSARQSYSKSNWTLEMIRYCNVNNIPYTLVTYNTEGNFDVNEYRDKLDKENKESEQ